MPTNYDCPTCGGNGEDICPHCEQDMQCEDCAGSGWNTKLVDVASFENAVEAIRKKKLGVNWWRGYPQPLMEGGERVGVEVVYEDEVVAYVDVRDHLRGERPEIKPRPLTGQQSRFSGDDGAADIGFGAGGSKTA